MKKKILYLFLTVLVIINLVLLFMILKKPLKKSHPQKSSFITEELQFTEDQKDRFFALDRMHRDKMRSMDNELRDLRAQLFRSFHQPNFSTDSIVQKMGEIEASKQKELFTFFREVRKLCDKNQVKRFDNIIDRVLHQRGPKPPDRDREMPPSSR